MEANGSSPKKLEPGFRCARATSSLSVRPWPGRSPTWMNPPSITGGPVSFTEEHIGRAHAHLRVRGVDFDEMAEVLQETLEDNGVDDASVARIIAQVTRMRGRIVAGEAGALPVAS